MRYRSRLFLALIAVSSLLTACSETVKDDVTGWSSGFFMDPDSFPADEKAIIIIVALVAWWGVLWVSKEVLNILDRKAENRDVAIQLANMVAVLSLFFYIPLTITFAKMVFPQELTLDYVWSTMGWANELSFTDLAADAFAGGITAGVPLVVRYWPAVMWFAAVLGLVVSFPLKSYLGIVLMAVQSAAYVIFPVAYYVLVLFYEIGGEGSADGFWANVVYGLVLVGMLLIFVGFPYLYAGALAVQEVVMNIRGRDGEQGTGNGNGHGPDDNGDDGGGFDIPFIPIPFDFDPDVYHPEDDDVIYQGGPVAPEQLGPGGDDPDRWDPDMGGPIIDASWEDVDDDADPNMDPDLDIDDPEHTPVNGPTEGTTGDVTGNSEYPVPPEVDPNADVYIPGDNVTRTDRSRTVERSTSESDTSDVDRGFFSERDHRSDTTDQFRGELRETSSSSTHRTRSEKQSGKTVERHVEGSREVSSERFEREQDRFVEHNTHTTEKDRESNTREIRDTRVQRSMGQQQRVEVNDDVAEDGDSARRFMSTEDDQEIDVSEALANGDDLRVTAAKLAAQKAVKSFRNRRRNPGGEK